MTRMPTILIVVLGIMGVAIETETTERTAGSATTQQTARDLDARLVELGIELPAVSKPLAVYRRVVVVDGMAYTSGHICISESGQIMTGKAGADVTTEEAQKAAARCAVAMLASLKDELGTLNRIERLVKTTGMVNCTADYTEQSLVINGFSNLMRDLMGESAGVGARSAVGMSSLPRGAIVEVEAIFKLADDN